MTLSLVVNSWRLKRREVKSLRETLVARTSSEERQIRCLKQLLQTDRSRLSAAMASVRQAAAAHDSADFDKVTLLFIYLLT